MNIRDKRIKLLGAILGLMCSTVTGAEQAGLPPPESANARIATARISVIPDHQNWTYRVGEPASFQIKILWDGHPLENITARYSIGPERMTAEEHTVTVPASGVTLSAGSMNEPGFLRCIVKAEIGGTEYRALATAAFDPEKILPTQSEPADFDAFWAAGKAELAKLPLDAEITPVPALSNGRVEVFRVSFQNVGAGDAPSRIYGTLCVPHGPGPFPAVLHVPGAGIRPYQGTPAQAEEGIITLDIGIHGIPVDMPPEVYTALERASLTQYPTIALDDRNRYYYRRVYLGCVRANDFLVTLPKWDRRNLFVSGGSQGGQLSIITAALDSRVTALSVRYPAFCDVTGYLHGRAGGWPHVFQAQPGATTSLQNTPAKVATSAYYDAVNFARRLKVPGIYSWGYNDEVCPPTSMFAAYGVIRAPKELLLAIETGHRDIPEQVAIMNRWLSARAIPSIPSATSR